MTTETLSTPPPPRAGGRRVGRRPRLPVLQAAPDTVLALLAAYWALTCNPVLYAALAHGQSLASTLRACLAAFAALTALHYLLLAPLAWRRTLRPLAVLLTLAGTAAAFHARRYGTALDAGMLQNVLHSDWREAHELLTPALLGWMLVLAAPPALLLARLRIAWPGVPRTLARRGAGVVIALLVLVVALGAGFQSFAAVVRNHKTLRYTVAPANAVAATVRLAQTSLRGAARPRQAVGLDARVLPPAAAGGAAHATDAAAAAARPRLVVLVVGETARAASWGLSVAGTGGRQTTPELAALPEVLNFADVTSCGTSTEVSLPCMFAAVGRRDYDEARIRGSDSLLHVAARAGVGVTWRDNQSGCKGVCEGLPYEQVRGDAPAALCDGDGCLDEALLAGLDERLGRVRGTQLLVLHMLGNHGPAYWRRHPAADAPYQPECRDDDLRRCNADEIRNAYDNALRYSDRVLGALVRKLQARAATLDSAFVYVSDHGESPGEHGLYLHGLPYAVAPDVQTRVPMLLWLSDGFVARAGLDRACLRTRAAGPTSHDHLFHSLLALLGVQTAAHDPAWDLTAGCRASAAPG